MDMLFINLLIINSHFIHSCHIAGGDSMLFVESLFDSVEDESLKAEIKAQAQAHASQELSAVSTR